MYPDGTHESVKNLIRRNLQSARNAEYELEKIVIYAEKSFKFSFLKPIGSTEKIAKEFSAYR